MCRNEVNYALIIVMCLTDEERFHLWFQASEKGNSK